MPPTPPLEVRWFKDTRRWHLGLETGNGHPGQEMATRGWKRRPGPENGNRGWKWQPGAGNGHPGWKWPPGAGNGHPGLEMPTRGWKLPFGAGNGRPELETATRGSLGLEKGVPLAPDGRGANLQFRTLLKNTGENGTRKVIWSTFWPQGAREQILGRQRCQNLVKIVALAARGAPNLVKIVAVAARGAPHLVKIVV